MQRPNFNHSLLWCLMALLPALANAQRQGNLVEYFGKEHIEKTDEGRVLINFRQGLAMAKAMPSGSLFVGQDIIAWQLSSGTFVKPAKDSGLTEFYPHAGQSEPWRVVEADTSGIFKGLINNYLYTSYISPREQVAILDATGHTRVYINGMPHEGDHYDYGYTLIPFILKKGLNEFIYTPGRYGRVRSKLVISSRPVLLCLRDLTLPSLIRGEKNEKWCAVRVINATGRDIEKLMLTCSLPGGEQAQSFTGSIPALSVRKVPFLVPATANDNPDATLTATLTLLDSQSKMLDKVTITLKQHDAGKHHERTFISSIDGSVQYYSVVPSLRPDQGQAFVLTLHGAAVEATNQARAYKQKDWAHLVAPTNRRPFGFNWEEWGRLDAMEVMNDALGRLKTDPRQTYLTGHSMGGHGTWFTGSTYPDRFAAIAPCAAYPDIITYRRDTDTANQDNPHLKRIQQAASGGRVYNLTYNLAPLGVFVLHGSADEEVSVRHARQMREVLGRFHNNFSYYEYPNGSHWYGDHSMDWPPLFGFLRQNKKPVIDSVMSVSFATASPGISSRYYWMEILQQETPYELSSIDFVRSGDTIRGTTRNTECLRIDLSSLKLNSPPVLSIDGQLMDSASGTQPVYRLTSGKWRQIPEIDYKQKHPARYGGFKLAFANNVVLVYGTAGTSHDNRWNKHRAILDAETWLYRSNGSFQIIADRNFSPEHFPDRNVILYGNADNNLAWKKLLHQCPIMVTNGAIILGTRIFKGDDLGTYFIYPRSDSKVASVGVVAASGLKGMKGAMGNNYFSGVTGYPDLMIFRTALLRDGLNAMLVSGFFDNDWGLGRAQLTIEQ